MPEMPASLVGRSVCDGNWELMSWDPATGKTTWATMTEDGNTVIRTDLPVQSTLDHNAEVRNSTPDGWNGDWHRIASVPMQLLYDDNIGLNKAIEQGDDKHLSRWLNDSQNRSWRTKTGKV